MVFLAFYPQVFSPAFPFGFSVSLLLGFTRTDPIINDILIEPPDSSNPGSRDDTLGGIFTDGDLVEFQVAG